MKVCSLFMKILQEVIFIPVFDGLQKLTSPFGRSPKCDYYYLRVTENWSEEKEGMVERLGVIRKVRRERIEKGSRER